MHLLGKGIRRGNLNIQASIIDVMQGLGNPRVSRKQGKESATTISNPKFLKNSQNFQHSTS